MSENIEELFRKIKYPSIDYPEKVAKIIHFPTIAYFQPKYDGSNVAIWVPPGENHLNVSSRNKAIADHYLANATLEALGMYTNLQKLKEKLKKDKLVLFCEMYGSKNTPAGYHKEHTKPIDIVCFDVFSYKDMMFLDPETATAMLLEMDIPFVEGKKLSVIDLNKMLEYATALSKYEGCVIKIYDAKKKYGYPKGMIAMKWKPQELVFEEGELPFSEICGVVAKALQEGAVSPSMKPKQLFRILRNLINQEAQKHGLRPPKSKNIIYRAWTIVRTRVITPEDIEKIIKNWYY